MVDSTPGWYRNTYASGGSGSFLGWVLGNRGEIAPFQGGLFDLQTGTSAYSGQEAGQCIQTDPPPYPFG